MVCPKCQLDIPPTTAECPRCGLVFAKQRPFRAVIRPTDEGTGSGVWFGLFVVAALALAGWYLRKPYTPDEPVEAAPATPATELPALVTAPAPALVELEAPEAEVPDRGEESNVRAKLEPAPPRPLPDLGRSSAWDDGADAYEAALSRLKAARTPVLVYVGADWCRYCKQLEGQVLTDSSVEGAIACATKVKLNEKVAADNAAAKALGVRGYPTILLFARPNQAPIHLDSGVSRDHAPNPPALARDFLARVGHAWHSEAHEALTAHRPDDAIEAADRVLALRGGDDPGGQLLHLRGLAFYEKKEWADALRDFTEACEKGHAGDCKMNAR